MPGRSRIAEKSRGFTLVEIIFSITLMAIIALGTAQYMVFSRWDIDRGIRKQLAWMTMASRLEQCVDFGFDAVADSIPEAATPLLVNHIRAYRSSVVTAVDDSTDGYFPSDVTQPDYYQIKVSISWFSPNNVTDSVTVYLSKETSWDY